MKSGLIKHIRFVQPEQPKNIQHFDELMQEPRNLGRYGTFGGKQFYVGLIEGNPVFLNQRVYDEVKHYKTEDLHFNIDGTFSVVPHFFKQLLIILVEKEDRVSFTILI